MNLGLLAPDIQEEILFLPRRMRGRDPIRPHHLQPIALTLAWHEQRALWRRLCMVKLRERVWPASRRACPLHPQDGSFSQNPLEVLREAR